MSKYSGPVFLAFILGLSNSAIAGDAIVGDAAAGKERFHKSCHACHGPAGKGASSYPKVSGKSVEYTREKLKAYREGQKFGPNSSLMIMMAKPLTDQEIEDLSVYLKDAQYKQ